MKKMCVQESLEGTYFEGNIKTSLVLYSYFLGGVYSWSVEGVLVGGISGMGWGRVGRKRERSKKAAPVVEAA